MSERTGSVYDIEAIQRAAGGAMARPEPMSRLSRLPDGRWHRVAMGEPAVAGDDWVVIATADYERWRVAWAGCRVGVRG